MSLLEKIKRLSIIAMVSDDDLMDILVLKGGNALNIIYSMVDRASIDIDFSIESDFEKLNISDVNNRIKLALENTFNEEQLHPFDIIFREKPANIAKEYEPFWGGYSIEFKIISIDSYNRWKDDIDKLRRNAIVTGPGDVRIYKIDISKFEVCSPKVRKSIDGYALNVYSPEMICFEKIRAICQQLPDYRKIVKTATPRGRSRDFYDIFCLTEKFDINFNSEKNIELLKDIFNIKRVPLSFMRDIEQHKDYFEQDFQSVKDTVLDKSELKEFNFYFNYVVKLVEGIKY